MKEFKDSFEMLGKGYEELKKEMVKHLTPDQMKSINSFHDDFNKSMKIMDMDGMMDSFKKFNIFVETLRNDSNAGNK